MPSQSHKQRLRRWGRGGAAHARLAELLATVWDEAGTRAEAYFRRLYALLGQADYDRLLAAWEGGQETPPDLLPKLNADGDACALCATVTHLDWVLHCAEIGGIPSEHYWYLNLGRVRPPKEWHV